MLQTPPPPWTTPTFQANPAAEARQLLIALLPPRPALRHVLQAHARLAVLGLATASVLPDLLAALPRLALGADAAYAYPFALFHHSRPASAYASNQLLRVLPQPLPLSIFPRLPHRNPHSFTLLLASLSNHLDDADPTGSSPKASWFLGAHVHALAVKAGAADDLYVRNALVHFYGVCGEVEAMRRVFDELPGVRDAVTWNAVVVGYLRSGMVRDARQVFDGMPGKDQVSWSTLVGGYVKEETTEMALKALWSMVVQGVNANEVARRSLFNPPLYRQRIEFAVRHINELNATTLVDFGCGAGSLFDSLLEHPTTLEKVVGVDISRSGLVEASTCLRQKLSKKSLEQTSVPSAVLYYGSITEFDSRLYGFDVGTCLEVIEHMEEDQASLCGNVILGSFCPKVLIVSTPNYEYNPILQRPAMPKTEGVPDENSGPYKFSLFRHHDHKFEWTRAQFQSWATDLAMKHDYSMEFSGVGGSGEEPGYASQIAIFRKLTHNGETVLLKKDQAQPYKLLWEWPKASVMQD